VGSVSLDLDTGSLDERGPALALAVDERSERLGRTTADLVAGPTILSRMSGVASALL
jgi:hypothetical protein